MHRHLTDTDVMFFVTSFCSRSSAAATCAAGDRNAQSTPLQEREGTHPPSGPPGKWCSYVLMPARGLPSAARARVLMREEMAVSHAHQARHTDDSTATDSTVDVASLLPGMRGELNIYISSEQRVKWLPCVVQVADVCGAYTWCHTRIHA